MTEKAQYRFPLLNTYVDSLSLQETVDIIEGIIAEKKPKQHVVINASKINLMLQNSLIKLSGARSCYHKSGDSRIKCITKGAIFYVRNCRRDQF